MPIPSRSGIGGGLRTSVPCVELVGRDRELAAVARALDEVAGGASRVLGVIGGTGIGKSALLAAAAEQARARGMLVLEGRAASHERYVPFSLAVDAFDAHAATMPPADVAALGPALAEVVPSAPGPPPGGDRLSHHRALRGLLELLARERPVALLLDDLHWADDASLELVDHLVQRPPAGAHLLAVASRRRGGPALRVLGAARRLAGFEELQLEPLGHAESLELLAAVPDARDRERMARDAGGNLLYLTELARAAGRPPSAVPCPVLGAVEVELAALAPVSRALVEGAAVAGDPFDPELAAAAAGTELEENAVDELVAADLVHPAGNGRAFAFRHTLVRRAVYHSAPPAWRLGAHERVARALERRGASPAARAHHVARFARAGDDAAIAVLTEAAAEAADPGAAVHWYEQALAVVGDGDRPRLLAPLGLALMRAGRLHEARSALDGARPARGVPRVELVVACSQLDALLGDPGCARRRLLAALEAIPREHGAPLALELAALANTTTERRRWLRHVCGADPLVAAGADALAAVADRDLEAIDRAAARLRELNDSTLAARLTVVARVARAQLELERLEDAAETTDRALAIAGRTQRQEALVELLELRATNLLLALELDSALREAEAAERLARSQGARHLTWLRAVILHHRGDVVAAERGAEATDPALSLSTARASCARAELLLARGEAAAAARLAEDAVAAAERLRARLDAAEARLLAGRAHAAAGDSERAKRVLQRVAADAARGGALRLRDAAARELRRLGTRVSARAHRDGQLTERERTVAELVADGHPNKQVAAALFLSEGTIENTLTRIYAKLGIRSRTQLTRTLAAHESRRLP